MSTLAATPGLALSAFHRAIISLMVVEEKSIPIIFLLPAQTILLIPGKTLIVNGTMEQWTASIRPMAFWQWDTMIDLTSPFIMRWPIPLRYVATTFAQSLVQPSLTPFLSVLLPLA